MEWQLWWRPIIISQESEDALVIYRTKDEHELVLVFNLSQESIDVKLNEISSNELFIHYFLGKMRAKNYLIKYN